MYGVAESDSDIALSDVEGQDDDGELPDVRAWGKDKRRFYSTDYVDPDYGGYQQKDSALAEFEEEEASNLQKQLMQQLDDDDFSLPTFSKASNKHLPIDTVKNIWNTNNWLAYVMQIMFRVERRGRT